MAIKRQLTADWDDVSEAYDKLLFWLYKRADPKKARPYADRAEKLLGELDPNHEAIFGEECRSLACESKGDLQEAIHHRENEIALIRKLRAISRGKPYVKAALRKYGADALSDRLDLLATLYHDNGDIAKAIAILEESQSLCKSSGIPFDGEDLLQEYRQEATFPQRQYLTGSNSIYDPGAFAPVFSTV